MVASFFASLGGGSSLNLRFLTGSLDPRVTFARASSGTRFNSAGVLELVGNNVPRFDHDPVTGAPRGLLVEGQRTNLLLNSLIDGTPLATQSVAVTATAHTLSFTGTGSVALSGAFTGSLAGTGANNRVALTFTPAAGALTVTVTGDVRFAQLEAASFASSFIPTGASQATRAADVAVLTGTNFSDWYRQDQGAFFTEFSLPATWANVGNPRVISTPTTATYMATLGPATVQIFSGVTPNATATLPAGGLAGQTIRAASAYAASGNNLAITLNGGAVTEATTTGSFAGVNQIGIGGTGTTFLFGHIRSITYWPTRLTNAQLQSITT